MAGFVIDIVLMYLFKSAKRVFQYFRSFRWERAEASFTDWAVVNPDWGCSSVRLHYEFVANERRFNGWDEIPFYMRWHSKTYAQSLLRDLHPIVRVNPENPNETRFFELDQ